MSIPPLVCNTPPPPDQCEDDRDTEDFDIHYNLSQEDEDDGNNYNYGTYSDYIYSTSTSRNIQDKWTRDISEKAEDKLPNNISKDETPAASVLSKSSSVNKLGYEDTVIEDLNLKLDDQNDVASSEQTVDKCDTETSGINCLSKDMTTSGPIAIGTNKSEYDEASMVAEDFVLANSVNDDEKLFVENAQPIYNKESVVVEETYRPFNENIQGGEQAMEIEGINLYETCLDVSESSTSIGTNQMEHKFDGNNETIPDNRLETDEIKASQHKLDNLPIDGDLPGDFDDFQFISNDNNPVHTIDYCDNPWDNEVSRDCEFGDFTANFDCDNNLHTRSDGFDESKAEIHIENTQADDTDDFGDFDDFKSSLNEHGEDVAVKNGTSQNVPVFSLHSPDSEAQIIESINGVLSSIFTSELSEVDEDFEVKLESLLNETWGHLMETDVRQPYIVNWNNSLGQKSLLKALCIDSRNILFGPKWHIGMPKYAANLTVAPLQPQKPFTPTNATNSDDQNADKNSNKETGTWTDPFTSNGQEYTYAEALLLDLEHLMATLDQMAHKHSSFKISELLTHACNTEGGTSTTSRPTNLDVFTNVTPQEPNKIYSTTLNVQPIRQINLPDTHIFTPTDSETPRSKTIHYDPGPTVLVPQRPDDIQTEEVRSQPKSKVDSNNSENDEEYWEFQDFKGPPIGGTSAASSDSQDKKCNETTTNHNILPIIVDDQTQILQPIKVEPVVPALNWPAPGEVKGAFDDFSDFVSNSSWNDNSNTVNQADSQQLIKQESEVTSKTHTTIDDDFETFQSAPTSKLDGPTESIGQSTVNINHNNINDFPNNLTNSNEISPSIHSKTDHTNTVQTVATNSSSTIKSSSIKSSPVFSSAGQNINTLLQPSVASTSGSQRGHKKTGQILQPLSLESYSQINWPNPGIDLQDLSRFNPVESLQSLKTDGTGGSSKLSSPAHKDANAARNETPDEDIWGDFVSSKPKQQSQAKKLPVFADDDEWTDFVSSPSLKPQNGLNTISFNVHTNLNMQKSSNQNKFSTKNNQISFDIPTLNYVTPKSANRGYNDKHFQNL